MTKGKNLLPSGTRIRLHVAYKQKKFTWTRCSNKGSGRPLAHTGFPFILEIYEADSERLGALAHYPFNNSNQYFLHHVNNKDPT
jgi:hypothetical protein